MSSKYIKFVVGGEPTGKGRPRFSTHGGFVRTHTDKKTESYEAKVIYSYHQHHEDMEFEVKDMIHARITAYYLIPKSCYVYHKKTNTTDLTKIGQDMTNDFIRPTKKPDCDNIAKIILDALNGIAYHDDSQVVGLEVEKYYDSHARVEVELWTKDITCHEI